VDNAHTMLRRLVRQRPGCPPLSGGIGGAWHHHRPSPCCPSIPPPAALRLLLPHAPSQHASYVSLSTPGALPSFKKDSRLLQLEALQHQRNAVESLALLRNIEPGLRQPLRRVVFHTVLYTCREALDAPSALAVLELMKERGDKVDARSYSAAVRACARGGDLINAERLLNEMKAAGCRAFVTHYTEIIAACRWKRDGRKALAFLETMLAEGVVPDQRVYAEVLGACGAQGLLSEAVTLLQRLAASSGKEGGGGVRVDHVMFSPLIKELASRPMGGNEGRKEGEGGESVWRQAWAAWEEVRRYDPVLTLPAFQSLQGCLSNAQHYSLLLELCRDLRERALAPPKLQQQEQQQPQQQQQQLVNPLLLQEAITTAAIQSCLSLHDHTQAKEWIHLTLEQGQHHPRAYQQALRTCLSLGQWDEMQRLFAQASKRGREGGDLESVRLMAMGAARLARAPMQELRPFLEEVERRGWVGGRPPAATAASVLSSSSSLSLGSEGGRGGGGGMMQRRPAPAMSVHSSVALELLRRRGGGWWEDALRVLDCMEKAADQLGDREVIRKAAATYERVMNAAVKAGDLEAATLILNRLQARGVPVSSMGYNSILYGCAQTGQLARARALFQEMLTAAAAPTATAGAPPAAAVLPPSPTLVNYNTMLLALAKQGEFTEAKTLLASMQPPQAPAPDIVSFNTVLAAGAASGDYEGIRAFFQEEMKGGGGREGGRMRPDIVSYNTMLSALQGWGGRTDGGQEEGRKKKCSSSSSAEKASAWTQALSLLQELQSTPGVAPNVQTFNTLMDIGCKSGHVDEARSVLLPTMHAAHQAPDRVTYNTLAMGFVRAKRYEEAMEVVKEGGRVGWDSLTYWMAFESLAGLKRDGELEVLFWERHEKVRGGVEGGGGGGVGYQRRSSSSSSSGGSRGGGVGREGGREDQALEELWSGMIHAGRLEDGLRLVTVLEKEINKKQGRRTKEETQVLTPAAFHQCLQACKASGNLDGALLLLREMQRRGLPLGIAAFDPVIRLCSIKHAWKKGLELLNHIRAYPTLARQMTRDLHNTRVSFFAQLKDLEGCRRALEEMRAEGYMPDGKSYAWALQGEAGTRTRNVGGVGELLDRAREEGWVLTEEMLLAHTTALKRRGDWWGGMQVLERVAADRKKELEQQQQQQQQGGSGGGDGVLNVTSHVLNNVLSALAQDKQWQRLLSLQASMYETYGATPDNVTYLYHLMALAQIGKWEETLTLFQQIRTGAFGSEVFPQDSMYTALLSSPALASDGRVAEIKKLLLMREEDGLPVTQHFLNSLIATYGRSGHLSEAVAVFESIPTYLDEPPDIVAFNALIMAHRLAGTPLDTGGLPLYRQLLSLSDAAAATTTTVGDAAGGAAAAGATAAAASIVPDGWTYTPLIASCEAEGLWPVAMYLYDESAFTMPVSMWGSSSPLSPEEAAAAAAGGGGGAFSAKGKGRRDEMQGGEEGEEEDALTMVANNALDSLTEADATSSSSSSSRTSSSSSSSKGTRFEVLKTLIASLDRLGVDLFVQDLYKEGYNQGVFNHWLHTDGRGRVMDFHHFSRPLAKAAIHHALSEFEEEQLEQRKLPWGKRRKRESPWVMIVGQGLRRRGGVGVLKQEVVKLLMELDPPLEAEVQANNLGRLVVAGRKIKEYTTARIERREGRVGGGKGRREGREEEGRAAVRGWRGGGL